MHLHNFQLTEILLLLFFKITGGKLNHTSTLTVQNSNERLVIVQYFRNLNAWDQLDVDVVISGSLPNIHGAVSFQDTIVEYVRRGDGIISSQSEQKARINDEEISIRIEQQVRIHWFMSKIKRN